MPQQTSTVRFRPVIRVFVSSTFSDLKQERNTLQEQVFPKLEQLCAQNGFQFQAIDLRWGVSSEAGLDHRTMRICLDELRRAQDISPRPNFLILLGNRYGWRPLPEEISVAEFQALERAAAQVATTTDQPAAAVLRDWYRRDENAVPPVYLLQSRRQQFHDAKDYTQAAPWNEVQAVLWEIINCAQPPEQLRGRFDAVALAEGLPPTIVRFQASATEQEIWHGALRVPDAQEHVLAFFRQIENAGEFVEPAQIKDFVDLEPSGKVYKALRDEQNRLKEALRTQLGEKNVFAGSARLAPARDAQGQPTANVTTNHLAQLCTDVEKRLTEIIQAQFEEYWNKTSQASAERAARELKIEQDEHERFGRERGGKESFVGRESELEAIRDYLQNASTQPLVVHGSSGCGKTALLARAAEEIQKSEVSGQKPEVIVRFIGVTPRSSDIRSLLGSLCQELRVRHPREGELPMDIKALTEELHEHFRSATAEQPLILFLDALDQLSDADNGRLLNWIPYGQLPPRVKLVVSCLSDRAKDDPASQPFAELTRRQLIAKNSINVDALSEEDASTLLFTNWLRQAGRKVSDQQREQIEEILKSEECRRPIYLKLLFEEARLWRSYDEAPKLGENVSAILGQLIERLSQPTNHGRLLVERVLGYLAASRHGLAENEILEILFADPEYKAALDQTTERTRHELPASATRIPIAIWSRLRFDFAPYLTERAAPGANVLTFYHRQVAEWVQEHFVKASDHSWQPHRRLADYFTACAKGTAEEWETDSVRGFAECVYQLIKAGQHGQAAALLSNFSFLLHKLRVRLVESVFEDYELLRREAPASAVNRSEIWSDFFREKAHILRRGNAEWPAHKILLQLAVEHADDSPLTIGAEQWLKEDHCDWLWLRRVPRLSHAQKNSCLAVFEGHTREIQGALEFADGRLVSWSDDGDLRLWNRHTSACLAVLKDHTSCVRGALVLADGLLLSWSQDKTLRLWDSLSGLCLAVFVGHNDGVRGALELADGRLVSWSDHGDLRLWNSHTGACLAVLEGHLREIRGVLKLADGRLLSWSNATLHLWDGQTGAFLAVLEDHTSWVNGALELADGRLLSWSADNTLRLWGGQSCASLEVLEGHTAEVKGALALSEGRLLSWSDDKTLRLWDSRTGAGLAVLEGHTAEVRGALVLADGRLLSWSWDNTLRLWDGNAGSLPLWDCKNCLCQSVLEEHTAPVMNAVALGGGRLLSWGGNTLGLWDSQSGSNLAVLLGHTAEVKGALELVEGGVLSWSRDHTLRLWDSQSESNLTMLEGHTRAVNDILELAEGRVLSWSDHTLRLWDSHNGKCIAVLEKHTSPVNGALELVDGRLLSWSCDNTLRLWGGQNSACLAVLEGHTNSVSGALELADGRLLSWSRDETLRLWDGQSCVCLAVFKGHTAEVKGALALSDGRLLSWSADNTLRIWDAQKGTCFAVLEGHASEPRHEPLRCCIPLFDFHRRPCTIQGALELAEGPLLSWSDDGTSRLWNSHTGECLAVVAESQYAQRHPDWLPARANFVNRNSATGDFYDDVNEYDTFTRGIGDFFATGSARSVHLRHKYIPSVLATWTPHSDLAARCLFPDGTVVVTEANGQVCFLKLF